MKKANAVELSSPETFQGIEKLEPKEQDTVRQQEVLLATATSRYELSSVEIGEHLSVIRQILEPRRMFNRWLRVWCDAQKRGLSRSWAYQLMKDYEVLKLKMPKAVLTMALERGAKINPQLLLSHPPPETKDKARIAKYLDNLSVIRVEVVKSTDQLLKEVVNFFVLRYDLLPHNHKTRAAFTRSVIGMIMAKSGVSAQAYEPMAIPEAFRGHRGRPLAVAA